MQFEGDDNDVAVLKNLLLKACTKDESDSFIVYRFGRVPFHSTQAVNDATFAESTNIPPNSTNSSDKNCAIISRFYAFLTKLLKRFFCHSNTLKRLILLAFSTFSLSIQEGQYKHYPTID